jgi:hypothetical protein
MENDMNEFPTTQKVKLVVRIVEQGVLFLFHRPHGHTDQLVQVMQGRLSVHRLLSKLRKGQTYCAKDVPLLVWMQGEELHIKFHSPNDQMVEECNFSGEETRGILEMLEKLPSLN